METFIYAAESPSFSPTAAVVTTREKVKSIFLPGTGAEESNRTRERAKMDGSGRCIHTYTIKGRAVVKTLEGEKLCAVGETLDQQEADYIAEGFRFANPARTNPNKEALPQQGSQK